MFSVYLSCLVVGGGLAIFSVVGELVLRGASEARRKGPVYALRSLVHSLAAFGATGLLLGRFEPGLGQGLTLVFAILAAWLVGGLVGTVLTLLGRPAAGGINETAEGNRS